MGKYTTFDYYIKDEIDDDAEYVKKEDVVDILNDITDVIYSIADDLKSYSNIPDINKALEKTDKLINDLY